MKRLQKLSFALTAVSAAFITASASAQILANDTVVINFTQTGNTAGENWNNVEGASGGTISAGTLVGDLIRFSDGATTGVALSIEGSGLGTDLFGIGGRTEPADPNRSFPASGAIPDIAQQNLTYHSDSPQRFVFSGLDDSLTYNLSVLSANTAGRNAHDWIANPGPDQVTISVDPDDTLVHTFSDLLTDGSGNLVLENTTSGAGVDAQHLNAMELTAIPEPATYAALAGLLALGLVVLRRRR
ncbi:MAG: PEP-CTERM sorting domain-containing protein [Opitutales bacterium]|nr:PEP-CTERM sorting domain-containing protein [Opitutales bacterium]